jgi:hypothetical protein
VPISNNASVGCFRVGRGLAICCTAVLFPFRAAEKTSAVPLKNAAVVCVLLDSKESTQQL